MRIAVVNNFFPPRVGGSSHLSHSLAQGYVEQGHEVEVITAAYPNTPPYEEFDGLSVYRFPAMAMPKTRLSVSFDMAFATRPTLRRRVDRVLGAFKPDVIHQHGQFFDLTWSTGRWAKLNDVPALLSIHTRLESPARSYQTLFRTLDAGVVKPIMSRYRPRLVVMDVHMRDYINKRYKGAFDGTVNIPVGVHPAGFRGGDPGAVFAKHQLDPNTPLIVSIGHVIPIRDRIALVEALPRVRDRVPDAKLVVVGGVYYDRYLTRAAELGVEDMLINTGAVPRVEVKNYLAAAAVESHDLLGYGFGTASLEAMGAGVPVVAAVRTDNFPDAPLLDGQNCYLVGVGDVDALAEKLVHVITHREEAAEVGQRGRSLVDEHFSMDSIVHKHLDVLESMRQEKHRR